ncbi:hypothetical protein BC833DRAFT_582522 [Globomyces pollinis-pini]|nr:hypothetical protein BC833DRAFT_582522 [Globomyces pollinis-pini]
MTRIDINSVNTKKLNEINSIKRDSNRLLIQETGMPNQTTRNQLIKLTGKPKQALEISNENIRKKFTLFWYNEYVWLKHQVQLHIKNSKHLKEKQIEKTLKTVGNLLLERWDKIPQILTFDMNEIICNYHRITFRARKLCHRYNSFRMNEQKKLKEMN